MMSIRIEWVIRVSGPRYNCGGRMLGVDETLLLPFENNKKTQIGIQNEFIFWKLYFAKKNPQYVSSKSPNTNTQYLLALSLIFTTNTNIGCPSKYTSPHLFLLCLLLLRLFQYQMFAEAELHM